MTLFIHSYVYSYTKKTTTNKCTLTKQGRYN